MSESLINLMKNKAAEKDPLLVFFRNQQRFIHLYLLSEGCEVTSRIIREIMESMGRKFASQTYYGLRRELEQEGWIDYRPRPVENVENSQPGVVEMHHYVHRDELSQFKKTIISSETVSRPVSVSKYHLFDMGMRFSDIQTLAKVRELQDYTQTLVKEYLHSVGEEATDDAPFTLFYPDFIFRGMLKEVVEFATAPISTQEELQTVMAGVFDRLVSHDHKKSILSILSGYMPQPWIILEKSRIHLIEILNRLSTIPNELREMGNSIGVYLKEELELIDKLRTAAQPTIDILSDFIRFSEPHGLWQLGQGDLIKPTPFFYTALREFPTEIRWPKRWPKQTETAQQAETAQYEFRLLNYETGEWMIDPIVTTNTDLTDLNFDQLDRNIRYEWRVYVYENGECPGNPWINGIFWLLPAETRESLVVAENGYEYPADLGGDVAPILQATLYTKYELYQEVIELLTPFIEPVKDSVESILFRRVLAAAYRQAYNSCHGDTVSFWSEGYVNEILNEEVKQIYCLELGLYETYQDNRCEECNECGLILQRNKKLTLNEEK